MMILRNSSQKRKYNLRRRKRVLPSNPRKIKSEVKMIRKLSSSRLKVKNNKVRSLKTILNNNLKNRSNPKMQKNWILNKRHKARLQVMLNRKAQNRPNWSDKPANPQNNKKRLSKNQTLRYRSFHQFLKTSPLLPNKSQIQKISKYNWKISPLIKNLKNRQSQLTKLKMIKRLRVWHRRLINNKAKLKVTNKAKEVLFRDRIALWVKIKNLKNNKRPTHKKKSLRWKFQEPREMFQWMNLKTKSDKEKNRKAQSLNRHSFL